MGDFEEGKIAIAAKMFTEGDNGLSGKTVKFLLPEGLQPEKEQYIQIAAVTENNPVYFAGGYTPDLIVSEKYAQQLMGSTFTELAAVEYEESFQQETEQRIKNVFAGEKQIFADTKLDQYAEMKNSDKLSEYDDRQYTKQTNLIATCKVCIVRCRREETIAKPWLDG